MHQRKEAQYLFVARFSHRRMKLKLETAKQKVSDRLPGRLSLELLTSERGRTIGAAVIVRGQLAIVPVGTHGWMEASRSTSLVRFCVIILHGTI